MDASDRATDEPVQEPGRELAARSADLDDDLAPGDRTRRRRLAAARSGVARRGARAAGRGARWGATRLVEEVLAIGPRLPVRDLATLRAQYPGRSPEEL